MKHSLARNLAAAFLSGPWTREGLVERGALACGKRMRWLVLLAGRVLAAFPVPPAGSNLEVLSAFIDADNGFAKAWMRHSTVLGRLPHQVFWSTPSMAPAAGCPESWPVPALTTSAALAEWLGLEPKELDWFADCQGREAQVPAGPLRHYTYRWLAKRSGKARLLEMPKQRLKAFQRRLLHDLLDHIPPHEAAHGYRRSRSVASYVAPHAGRSIVLHFDLRDFFPSVRAARVHALFSTAGYPPSVARLLTGLCTNAVPPEVWLAMPAPDRAPAGERNRQLYRYAHLPQGAPTSPALANLCAYRLDCRLAALARMVGARYTRYADDLAFSGDEQLERSARRFQVHVCRIALEEGFEIHTRKTRFMRQSVRQQLGGLVVNSHPNVQRAEYDRLKAILYNCVRHGPDGQNRESHADFRSHLAARIAYVAMVNASRGRRLRAVFDQIQWEEEQHR
jgi:hypothetical protein